jgi:hypothetical protein
LHPELRDFFDASRLTADFTSNLMVINEFNTPHNTPLLKLWRGESNSSEK